MAELGKLIVKMAIENPSWGYTRIQGALANLRHVVGRGTIANVLKAHGIEPAPQRGKRTSRSTFLKAIGRCSSPLIFLGGSVDAQRARHVLRVIRHRSVHPWCQHCRHY